MVKSVVWMVNSAVWVLPVVFLLPAVISATYVHGDISDVCTPFKQWSENNTIHFNNGEDAIFSYCNSSEYKIDRRVTYCRNGKPQDPLPICRRTGCDVLGIPAHGSKLCKPDGTSIGTVCSFRCQNGYYLKGSVKRICNSDSLWTGQLSYCVVKIECPIPPPLSNGKVIGCSKTTNPLYNDICHFECNRGFTLQGPDSLTCELNGKLVDSFGLQRFPRCLSATGNQAFQDPNTYYKPNPPQSNLCDFENGGCDQICDSSTGSIKCSCRNSYRLNVDRKTCTKLSLHPARLESPPFWNENYLRNSRVETVAATMPGETVTTAVPQRAFSTLIPPPTNVASSSLQTSTTSIPPTHDMTRSRRISTTSIPHPTYVVSSSRRISTTSFHHPTNVVSSSRRTSTTSIPRQTYVTSSSRRSFGISNSRRTNAAASNSRQTYVPSIPRQTINTPIPRSCGFQNGYCEQVCTFQDGFVQCACYAGFILRGDNKTCSDIDECSNGNFGCSHKCVNTLGSARCECRPGYNLHENNKDCIDIDECLVSHLNKCQHKCHNKIGSYYCSCSSGYILTNEFQCEGCRKNSYSSSGGDSCIDCPPNSYTDSDGKSLLADCTCFPGFEGSPEEGILCEDVDECTLGMLNCSHSCLNTPGGATCMCPTGFELEEDGLTCRDIDECSTKNGGCEGTCTNFVGNFSCSCPPGFDISSKNLYSCEDVDECSTKNGNCEQLCVNYPGGHHCSCTPGYHIAMDGKSCTEVRCPRLFVPHFSTLRCLIGGNRTIYNHSTDIMNAEEFLPNTICRVKCNKGYDLTSPHSEITCQANGSWNASLPSCKVLKCLSLLPPKNGDIYPPDCKDNTLDVLKKCYFTCNAGYRLLGSEYALCKRDLSWRIQEKPICIPEVPYLSCPKDIVTKLEVGKSSARISVDPPHNNLEEIQLIPSWLETNISTEFPAGTTDVTFTGSVSENRTLSCRMTVTVLDEEPPIFVYCPEIIDVNLTSSSSTALDWNEPIAKDNVGIQNVVKTLETNTMLTSGTHVVEYFAKDFAGNIAKCSFKINVTKTECEDLADPENGDANCMDLMSGKVCEPTCHSNYTRNPDEFPFYICDESGRWEPSSTITPCLPECSENQAWNGITQECEE